jgi:hypothetical protein
LLRLLICVGSPVASGGDRPSAVICRGKRNVRKRGETGQCLQRAHVTFFEALAFKSFYVGLSEALSVLKQPPTGSLLARFIDLCYKSVAPGGGFANVAGDRKNASGITTRISASISLNMNWLSLSDARVSAMPTVECGEPLVAIAGLHARLRLMNRTRISLALAISRHSRYGSRSPVDSSTLFRTCHRIIVFW